MKLSIFLATTVLILASGLTAGRDDDGKRTRPAPIRKVVDKFYETFIEHINATNPVVEYEISVDHGDGNVTVSRGSSSDWTGFALKTVELVNEMVDDIMNSVMGLSRYRFDVGKLYNSHSSRYYGIH